MFLVGNHSCCTTCILVIVLVKIELQTKVTANGISWALSDTACKSLPNLSVDANRLYTKHCALAIGETYELTCKSLGEGWGSNFLLIENSKYCEYTWLETKINITITGKFYETTNIEIYICNYLSPGSDLIFLNRIMFLRTITEAMPD